jgi:hypothetical protein
MKSFIVLNRLSMEITPENFVNNLRVHLDAHELAHMIFAIMKEDKFLALYDALMPLNCGPLDHLLNDTQCNELLWKRFLPSIDECPYIIREDLEGVHDKEYLQNFYIMPYNMYVSKFNQQPNLGGIAWILRRKAATMKYIQKQHEKRMKDMKAFFSRVSNKPSQS